MLRFHSSIFAISFIFVIICLVIFSFFTSYLFVIIHISELGLFLLSLVDNNYADKTLVYKVVSYT